jgi:uncharacterized protein (DUF58 family)
MLPEELLKKVRQIEFATRKRVDDVMSGNYRSSFKGQGVTFSEHRQYVAGDDIRHIDWKVSARSRDPLVKKYEEEREISVLLVVDLSGSESFGSEARLKSEIAAELAGMIAFAAVHTGDKIGALLFASEVEKIIPPKKGRAHVQRIIREVLGYQPRTRGTQLGAALDAAGRILRHSGIVFVVSDFRSRDYVIPLKRLARRHEVTAIRIDDRRELEVPAVGWLRLEDPETGEESWVDTGSYAFRNWHQAQVKAHSEGVEAALKSTQATSLALRTDEDCAEKLVRFFGEQARRIRSGSAGRRRG